MTDLTLTIPRLYADHHVLRVRQTLLALSGVEEVNASSAFKEVVITYDPARVSPQAIISALTGAGYPPGEPEVVERTADYTADPAWDNLAPRVVATDPVDLQMSGEFRKY